VRQGVPVVPGARRAQDEPPEAAHAAYPAARRRGVVRFRRRRARGGEGEGEGAPVLALPPHVPVGAGAGRAQAAALRGRRRRRCQGQGQGRGHQGQQGQRSRGGDDRRAAGLRPQPAGRRRAAGGQAGTDDDDAARGLIHPSVVPTTAAPAAGELDGGLGFDGGRSYLVGWLIALLISVALRDVGCACSRSM